MSSETTTITAKTTVILTGPPNWDTWIGVIKHKANKADIWKYMNPYLEADKIQKLEKPTLPKQGDIISKRTTPSSGALTPMESATFQDLLNEYKKDLAEYNTQRSSINTLSSYIIETISSLYQPAILDCDSEYGMLTTLMNRVAPTDRARSIELIESWKKALKAVKKQDQEIWLANLEKIHA